MKRFIDRPSKREEKVECEYLLTSLGPAQLDAEQMLRLDREYWGIESGLHQRLDVSALEDKSRIRTPKAALNLCLFRRAAMSFAIHWLQRQPDKRLATTTGFYDAMSANGARKAFSLVSVKHPSWLPRK